MSHPFNEHRQHKVEKDRVSQIRGYATGGAVAAEAPSAPAKAKGGKVSAKPTARMTGGKVKQRLDKRARGGKAKCREDGGEADASNIDTASRKAMMGKAMRRGAAEGAADMIGADTGRTGRIVLGGSKGEGALAVGEGLVGAGLGALKARKQMNSTFRADEQPAGRARGGRTKGKTHVTVNVMGGQHPNPVPVPVPAGGPPPGAMPPRPPMAPPMAGPPGMPPGGMPAPGMMPPRKNGGRVARASGGSVKDGPAWKEGLRSGTQITHTDGKSDLKDVGRGKAITYNKGGKVPQMAAGAGSAPVARRQVRASGGKVTPGGMIHAVKGASGVDRLGVTMSEGGGPKMHGGSESGIGRLEKTRLARRGK